MIVGWAIITTFHPLFAVGQAAEPVYPLTAAVTEQGTVYVSDLRLPGLWKVEQGKGDVFFQASPKFRTPLNAVRCVRVDRKSRVLACDSSTREIYRFDDQGQPHGLTGGKIGIPMDVAENPDGELFVSDLETQRIWKIPADGGAPTEFAVVAAPRGMRFDQEGRLWIVSHGKDQLVRIVPDGAKSVVVAGRPFQFPHEVLVQDDGTALVSDGYAKAVWKVSENQKPEPWVQGEPLQNPVGLCRSDKAVLIVDPRAKTVFAADAAGQLTVFWKGTEK
jgi:glucose/arabinose dehydrogenase